MKRTNVRMAGILVTALSASAAHAQFTVTPLGNAGGGTSAVALNSSGEVTGWTVTAGGAVHSFITGANGVGMTLLGTPPGQGGVSYAQSINDSGQVAGYFVTWGGVEHAFATGANGASMTDLGTLGGSTSLAAGINASGKVVGSSATSTPYQYHAFISGSAGGMADLGPGYAFAINATGQVAGYSASGRAFLTGPSGGAMKDLGTLGGSSSEAFALNNLGQVVGYSTLAAGNNLEGFITGPNGVGMRDIGTLGGPRSIPAGVNDAGVVVGWSYTASYDQHAFVTGANGVGMTDLNTLVKLADGATLMEAAGINDAGQIIVNASDGEAYLLTGSVPEPGTFALLLSGLGLLGLRVHGRSRAVGAPT